VKAGAILQETLALREQRAKADAGNNLEQSFLAWTLGQIGEVEKARHHQPASIQAYAKSVEMFDKLDAAGVIKRPILRARMNRYRVCFLLQEEKLQAAVQTAANLKENARDKPNRLYEAASLYALCTTAAKEAKKSVADAPASEKLADESMTL